MRLAVASLLLLFGAAAFCLAAGSAVGEGPCAVGIHLGMPEADVTVSELHPGTGTLKGNVSFTLPANITQGVISLHAAVEAGWPISVSPSIIYVKQDWFSPTNFSVVAVAPERARAGTTNVTIEATVDVDGVECASDRYEGAQFHVLPYVYDMDLYTDPIFLPRVHPGQEVLVTATLDAQANQDFTVGVTYGADPGVDASGPDTLQMKVDDNGTAHASWVVRLIVQDYHPQKYHAWVSVQVLTNTTSHPTPSASITLDVQEDPLGPFGSPITWVVFGGLAATAAWLWYGARRPPSAPGGKEAKPPSRKDK